MSRNHNFRWGKAAREFTAYCAKLLMELQTKQFDELKHFLRPADQIEIRGRKGEVYVVIEEINKDTLHVIVQGALPFRILPFGSDWFADGFRLERDGTHRELSNSELRAYD